MSTARRSRPSSAKSPSQPSTHRDLPHSHLHHVSQSHAPSPLAPGGSGGGLLGGSSSQMNLSPSLAGGRPHARDSEELTASLREQKEGANALKLENAFLKAQMQRLIAQLRKKDKQIEQITAMKISAVSDATGADAILAGQLRELKSEMTAIAKLTDKFRELEASHQRKEEELRKCRSAMKFTLIKELEIEAQTYYNECRRMKQQNQLQAQQMAQMHQVNAQLQTQIQQQQQQHHHPHGHAPPSHHHHPAHRPATAGVSSSNGIHPPSSLSPAAAAAAAQRDHEMFSHLRSEVSLLRAENLRLRSEAASTTAGGGGKGKGGSSSSLHVLNQLTKLQAELQNQIALEDAQEDSSYADEDAPQPQGHGQGAANTHAATAGAAGGGEYGQDDWTD